MKKTLSYILLCGLTLLLAACNKNNENQPPVSTMQGVFFTAVPEEAGELNLLPGKGKNVDAFVCVKDSASSDITLKFSLKVDPEGVAVYNRLKGKNAEMLPSSAYEFVKTDLLLPRYNITSTAAKLRITASDLTDGKLYVLPLAIDKVEGTDNWILADQPYGFIAVTQVNEGPEGGDGSMEYPFELKTVADLKAMKDKLSEGEKVYFKMKNDIDMADVNDWTPLNYASPYKLYVDFDGGGHTISNFHVDDWGSYPSFFGVLAGYCHDVTFTNARIECGADSGCGILGGYCGTGDIHGDVARVHVQGSVTLKGSKTGVGGMFGILGNATLEACSADVDVWSAKNYVGGLFGYSKKATVSNCWVTGSVRGDQRVGGITGGLLGDGDAIYNSYCTAKMYALNEDGSKDYAASRSVGGIVGHANQDKGDGNETRMPGNVVSGCIAWQEEIKTRSYTGAGLDGNDWYSAGAIVAYGATHNTYENCYRRADLDFRDYSDLFKLYDQENTSATAPLMIQAIEGNTHNYPYHGKAAPAGSTITQLAKSLGWDPAIWDFSKDVPTLRPDAPVGPIPDTNNDGQLPGFDNNDIK